MRTSSANPHKTYPRGVLKHRSRQLLQRASQILATTDGANDERRSSSSGGSDQQQENHRLLAARTSIPLPQLPPKALLAEPRPELPLPLSVEPAVPDRQQLKVSARAGNELADYRGTEDARLIYAHTSREFARSPMPPAGLASDGADVGDVQPVEPEEPPKPLSR